MAHLTDNLRQEIEERKDALVWWGINHQKYEPIIKDLKDLGLEPRLSTTGLDVFGTGDKQLLIGAFRAFRRHGFNTTSRPGEKATYYSTFFYPEDGGKGIWFSFSSTVCQRVQVGTELKEVPVYEIQCGESMAVTEEEIS